MSNLKWIHSTEAIPYQDAMEWMNQRIEEISHNKEPETVWLLEHPPVYTIGTSGSADDVYNKNIETIQTNRGGKVTYHGPGQRIVYLMLRLSHWNNDVKAYVNWLQDWIIEALRQCGIEAIKNCKQVGIWVDASSQLFKIGSIGIRVRKGISLHGVAININPDLKHFEGIIPCGVQSPIISASQIQPRVTLAQFDLALKHTFKI